uniref:Uncharacterized protein n=1 Tax=Rhizophora mucronata TaxID=61149 RepID=A0A2P2Q8V8_RHIMU
MQLKFEHTFFLIRITLYFSTLLAHIYLSLLSFIFGFPILMGAFSFSLYCLFLVL